MSPHDSGVDALIEAYVAARAGQRGIDAYAWLVGVLRADIDSHSSIVRHASSAAVVTTIGGASVLHSLSGDAADAAVVIELARELHAGTQIRGLALPGDRATKNLFEEARMPAQVLLH